MNAHATAAVELAVARFQKEMFSGYGAIFIIACGADTTNTSIYILRTRKNWMVCVHLKLQKSQIPSFRHRCPVNNCGLDRIYDVGWNDVMVATRIHLPYQEMKAYLYNGEHTWTDSRSVVTAANTLLSDLERHGLDEMVTAVINPLTRWKWYFHAECDLFTAQQSIPVVNMLVEKVLDD
jgi:hypothetical protein